MENFEILTHTTILHTISNIEPYNTMVSIVAPPKYDPLSSKEYYPSNLFDYAASKIEFDGIKFGRINFS
jgi:hypothetical protein